MKKTLTCLFVSLFLLKCGGGGPFGGSSFIYESVKEIAPEVRLEASVATVRAQEGFSEGSVLKLFHLAFEEYEYPRDEGSVGMGNIYKTVWEIGGQYNYAQGRCTDIDERVINPPFSLDLEETYNCLGRRGDMDSDYASGFAIDKGATNNKKFLLTYRWAPERDKQEEHGILQGTYNEADKEIDIKLLHFVDYKDEEDPFVIRLEIKGNETEHRVDELRMIDDQGTSFVGAGITRGEDEFFLLRTSDDEYFCIPAGATKNDLIDLDEDGPQAVVPPDCLDYETIVNAIDQLEESDVPSDFQTDFGGTIFLE